MEIIASLVKAKITLFLEYEATCTRLLSEDLDSYGEILDYRDQIIEKINGVNEEIKAEMHQHSKEMQACFEQILSNQIDYGDVNQEALDLFETSQQLYQVMSRLTKKEEEIMRIMNERKELLAQQIKVSNNLPKINRYFQTNQIEQDDSKNIGKI